MAPRKQHVTPINASEPVLIGRTTYNPRYKVDTYMAVDYMHMRFRIGDHVAMYNEEGTEWICVLETLYRDPETGAATFNGCWFWSLKDIRNHHPEDGEPVRASRCEAHELILCDNRDTNLVESISRKCSVLSWNNFSKVRRLVTKASDPQWRGIYFCERQYYHRAHRFTELNVMLFPGDLIPEQLRIAAGLPEIPNTTLDDPIDVDQDDLIIIEPDLPPPAQTQSKKKSGKKKDKEENLTSGTVFSIW